MGSDQILYKFLELVSVHLEKCLRDGKTQFDLFRFPDSVQRKCHYMGAVKNVFVATATRHGGDLAAVKTDGHSVDHFRFRLGAWFGYSSTQMKP